MKKAGEASAAAWNHLKKKIVSVIDLEKVRSFRDKKNYIGCIKKGW